MSEPVAIREAATVALLRDGASDDHGHGDGGLQVLLLRRHGGHVFGANAHVFPGGAVDDADADRTLAAHIGSGRARAEARLGATGRPLAYWAAAIRECFEEAGVLIACDCGHIDAARRASARDALNAGTRGWTEVVADFDLRFSLDEIVYFAHWVTPVGPPKRYSTRFFAARAPADQPTRPDGCETTDAWWATPAEALAANGRGEVDLMPPTRATLERLCEYACVAGALAGLTKAGVAQA